MRVALLSFASLAVALSTAAPCGAQPARAAQQTDGRSEAEVRFHRGMELFNVRNFEGALAEFQRSYELSGMPGLLYNLARAYQALGRYPEAARSIKRYLREETNLTPERRAEVEQMLADTRSFIARIDLRIEPTDARVTVTLDGDLVDAPQGADGLAVGPGRHTVEASGEGWQTASGSVVLASGDRRELRLTLRRATETRVVEVPSGAGVSNTRIVFTSTPEGATARVDGREVTLPASDVAPGRHAVELSAPGHHPWRGSVELASGATRVVSARLASTRGLAPVWLIAGAAATGVFLLSGAVFGALTESAHDEYALHAQSEFNSPDVVAIRERGETTRALANASFGLAAAAGVATVVIATQTRFRRESSAEITMVPTTDGAAARLRVTF